jgi:4-hydroxy-tetrahydrodipicolinate synthase
MVVPMLSLGGIGVISTTANLIRPIFIRWWSLYLQGDVEGARKIQTTDVKR